MWIEVTEDDCLHLRDGWHDALQDEVFSGRLANELADYPGTYGLTVSFRTRAELPAVHVEGAHELATEQREGISEARANQLAATSYH